MYLTINRFISNVILVEERVYNLFIKIFLEVALLINPDITHDYSNGNLLYILRRTLAILNHHVYAHHYI